MPLQLPIRLHPDAPHLDHLTPRSAIPGGSFEVTGSLLLKDGELPEAFFGETPASFDMARPTHARIRVPSGAISSDLVLRRNGVASNVLHANVGVPMAEDLHLVSNPAIDADGNLFAMVSGPRGEKVPVSIYRIARDLQMSAFAHDLLNISALAFDPTGNSGRDLYASSRADGTIYRITPEGHVTTFSEGMGIATGIAFDRNGNLFVGDRSGTIFRINPTGEIFVFATLEPSVAFYHLCFHPDGRLLVTAPTTSSNQPIYAIDRDGNTTTFFHGLGRPQGMAFDVDANLYVAASLQGERGIIRVWPSRLGNEMHAELTVTGSDIIGLCFLDDGCCALATHTTLFHADLGIEGLPLI
ncbi:gluconolaconase [Granulicella sp. 5B5]|uniref:SMP-30/gluconolactonase/LRE family protein n=1 Tax=Granulicella sp. 5B5 TaxID=1617967 RepID=UPI0015F756B2|nr:gluconolaconase [Granulicella sp. 5B5]QMV18251.1 gluconolaconase [Granulicella sp. 5B5]